VAALFLAEPRGETQVGNTLASELESTSPSFTSALQTDHPPRPSDELHSDSPNASSGTGTGHDIVRDLLQSIERPEAATSTTALDNALAALKGLITRQEIDDAEWMRTARLLRSAAVERTSSSPRAASVALLLSDALSFTDADSIGAADRAPLTTGLRTLLQPFISTDQERSVLAELLAHRWYVTPAFAGEDFATAAGV
jgi:hypothetical protein